MEACRHIEERLSAYLDRELTQQDRQWVDVHLEECAACRATLDALQRIHEGIANMPDVAPTTEQWSRMMGITATKTSRGLGWILGIGGGLLLAGYAAFAFATDDATDALVKIGVASVVVGAVLLLVSVWAERIRVANSDRYKDVEL